MRATPGLDVTRAIEEELAEIRQALEAFSTEITIRRGDTTPLNVSLRTR